ncbi:MAG TPA: hypothetical protein VMW54_00035 [Terriglobia bacterium]|nr:hypothetical protein [Terriglobia bacterium]
MNNTIILLALILSPTASALGQRPRAFMGHLLGETYQQAMNIIKATKGMSVTEAGKCVTTSVESDVDQPNECFGDQSLSDAIEMQTTSRSRHFVNFDFVNSKLIRIDVAGCASGISQVRLLEKKFGKYDAVKDMPFKNTTGSLLYDKEWDWWLPAREHLYVLEDFGSLALCGGTGVSVVFERPRKRKAKVVNPY